MDLGELIIRRLLHRINVGFIFFSFLKCIFVAALSDVSCVSSIAFHPAEDMIFTSNFIRGPSSPSCASVL